MKAFCPICGKRKPERFCPAKGEKICAVCCGREREVTIDCPSDCAYLRAAHRYELEHPKASPPEQMPFPDVEFPVHLVEERSDLIAGLAYTILKFAEEHKALNDADVFTTSGALAETYRTLGTGIYFERAPDAALPHLLYGELSRFLKEYQQQSAQTELGRLKDTEAFDLLVFLLRLGRRRTNGRPLSRAFLGFLRAQFPRKLEEQTEASRIIIP
jgi:hypothetical protein